MGFTDFTENFINGITNKQYIICTYVLSRVFFGMKLVTISETDEAEKHSIELDKYSF